MELPWKECTQEAIFGCRVSGIRATRSISNCRCGFNGCVMDIMRRRATGDHTRRRRITMRPMRWYAVRWYMLLMIFGTTEIRRYFVDWIVFDRYRVIRA